MYNDKKINHTVSAAQLVFIPALEQIFFFFKEHECSNWLAFWSHVI